MNEQAGMRHSMEDRCSLSRTRGRGLFWDGSLEPIKN